MCFELRDGVVWIASFQLLVYSILSIFLTNIVIVGVDKVGVDQVIFGIDSKIVAVGLLIFSLIVAIPMNIIGIVGAIQRRKVRAHVRACVCLSVTRVLPNELLESLESSLLAHALPSSKADFTLHTRPSVAPSLAHFFSSHRHSLILLCTELRVRLQVCSYAYLCNLHGSHSHSISRNMH